MRQQPSADSIAWWDKVPRGAAGAYLGKAFMKVCLISARAEQLRASEQNEETRQRLLVLMQEAEEADHDLQSWNQGASPGTAFRDIGDFQGLETGNPSRTGSSSQAVHVYSHMWMASLWNFYRTGRIALHSTLLECADFLDITEWSGHEAREGSPSSKYAKSICAIDLIISEICASILFILGDVDSDGKFLQKRRQALAGFHFMWPLYIVKNCQYATSEQVTLCQAALKRIGYIMGIKQALVMHDLGPLPRIDKLSIGGLRSEGISVA
jgi:hypothetical protein